MEYKAPPWSVSHIQAENAVTEQIEGNQGVCESIYDYGCSCMVWLQTKFSGVDGYDAVDLVDMVNAFQPQKGDVVVFLYDNGVAHGAFVEETYLSSFKVSECNFTAGECGERIVKIDDPAIQGYIHKITW